MEVQEFMSWVVSQVEAQRQGGVPSVNWVDGVTFLTGEFIQSPKLVQENLEGRLHYAVVFFTETSFQPEKKVTISGRDYVVRMVNAESNPNFVELAKFLKNFRR